MGYLGVWGPTETPLFSETVFFAAPLGPCPFEKGVSLVWRQSVRESWGARAPPPAAASPPGHVQTSALNSGRFTAGGWAARAPGRR